MVAIDNVGITVIACVRGSSLPRTTTRKFKASCGSVTEFAIDEFGKIVDTKHHHLLCKLSCEACIVITASATKLIESGK